MKAIYGIGVGSIVVALSAATWIGCSSSNATPPGAPTDSGSASSSSSSGSGSDSGSGSGGGDAAPTPDAAALTWTQVYADVIGPHCSGCHAPSLDGGVARGGFRVGMLDMSNVDAGYANLINIHAQGTAVPAIGYDAAVVCDTLDAGPGSVRVVPGMASSSLLCLKLGGFTTPPPCGAPMPEPAPGPGPIDGGQAAAFAEVQSWINQGALP